MAGYRRFVARHIAKIASHHKAHKKHFLKVFHVIRRHPGAYKAGYRPSRAAAPKSLPRKPAGLNKEASGLWDWAKKGWSWVKSKFSQHKDKIYDHAKKVAGKAASHVAGRVGSAAKRVGSRVIERIETVANNNIDHYVNKAEKKIDQLGKKAESKISKWDKKASDGMPGKSGSGAVMRSLRRAAGKSDARDYMRDLYDFKGPLRNQQGQRVDRLGRTTKGASGVFSRKFKRRARAGVRAFRQQR